MSRDFRKHLRASLFADAENDSASGNRKATVADVDKQVDKAQAKSSSPDAKKPDVASPLSPRRKHARVLSGEHGLSPIEIDVAAYTSPSSRFSPHRHLSPAVQHQSTLHRTPTVAQPFHAASTITSPPAARLNTVSKPVSNVKSRDGGKLQDFLASDLYDRAEQNVQYEVDGLRKSNALNDDAFDYAIVVNNAVWVRQVSVPSANGGSPTVQLFPFEPDSPGKSSVELHDASVIVAHAVILDRLRAAGLEVQEEPTCIDGQRLLKLAAAPDVLEAVAEHMRLKIRLKRSVRQAVEGEDDDGWNDWAVFDSFRRDQYLGTADPNSLFRSAERQAILHHMLYSMPRDAGGVELDDSVLRAAVVQHFPLHMRARRERVAEMWLSQWRRGFVWWQPWRMLTHLTAQPHDAIADYFGEEIAFYFAWLGCYTNWLVAPTLFGVCLFIAQAAGQRSIVNSLSPLFCLFLACWATLHLESWQRRAAEMAAKWGVLDWDRSGAEHTRLSFVGERVADEKTGTVELHFPAWRRWLRRGVTWPLLAAVVSGSAVGVMYLFSSTNSALQEWSAQLLSTPVVYGCMIPLLDYLYSLLAVRCNSWENYAYDSVYYRHLILKVFPFRFVNSFLALFYYAFQSTGTLDALGTHMSSFLISGQLLNIAVAHGWPYCQHRYKLWRAERELSAQIAHRRAMIERVVQAPGSTVIAVDTMNQAQTELPEAWRQSKLPLFSLFDCFCKMIVQFGYVTFFSVAFPLAPCCALINNIIEIRGDAFRLLEAQRPNVRRASGIGIWLQVLQLMSIAAVLTNCALIAFSSQQLDIWFPGISPSTKLLAIFGFEHFLLVLKFLIQVFYPKSSVLAKHRLGAASHSADAKRMGV